MNTDRKLENHFFAGLLLIVLVLLFFIFQPFLYTLILAVVIGVIFAPVYSAITRAVGGRQTLAAFISIIIILLTVLAPFVFFSFVLYQEMTDLYISITQGGAMTTLPVIEAAINNFLASIIPASFGTVVVTDQDFANLLSTVAHWFSSNLSAIFSSVFQVCFQLFLLIVILFSVLTDGQKFRAAITDLLPVRRSYQDIVIKKLHTAITSVIGGTIVVALIQGVIASIGLAIFGVPNPILWGGLAATSALVPTVGTSLVIGPAVIYLFLTGHVYQALGLLAWGVLAVGLIDNLLGPKLIQRKLQIHSLFILLSVLGGLVFFGPIGFILGPLTVSLLYALLDIYQSTVAKPAQEGSSK